MDAQSSLEPFASFAEAAEAVLDAPDAPLLARRLLNTLLAAEERAQRAEAEAATDVLTNVASRRQWERAILAEEHRCSRYGHPACIVALDLDGMKHVNDTLGHRAGDDLLRAAASAVRSASRATDVVARVGGDEFALLAVDTDLSTGRVLVTRLAGALAAAGVEASLGLAERGVNGGLALAWSEADRRMYTAKRRRVGPAAVHWSAGS